jgi:hypothetical protein
MQAIIFRIVPTALEISLVCGILVGQFTSQRQNVGRDETFRRINLVGTLRPLPR